MSKRILVIDDDRKLGELLSEYLSGYDFQIRIALDGSEGRKAVDAFVPDLLVLDVMLPGESGLDILRDIRKSNPVPVLILTARGEEEDRIVGLELGADDYLPKPFHPRELLARIRAILRRSSGNGESENRSKAIELAGVRLMPESYRAQIDGEDLGLSGTEFSLLRVLMENAGRVLGREEMMNLSRGRDHLAFDRSIDVHISAIRKKLRSHSGFRGEIRTVWGAGYLFSVTEDFH